MQAACKSFHRPPIAILLQQIGSAALIVFFMSAISAAAAPTPKYAPKTVPLSRDHVYFQNPAHPAPDYWALSGKPVADSRRCNSSSWTENRLNTKGRTKCIATSLKVS
ncbi:hypothetical protein [Trichlorobacter thiogenes]|uniref:hypothetical protein n=1 Tax=Trichlorobacter thiogenes TaxID=115783 RepID=UPI001115C8CB|nr:hypothetical protein [Trichlorobacter thiogenes]